MADKSDDHIHIEQLEIWARVGVSDAEREKVQRLVLNLTLWPVRPMDDLGDNVRKTVDYSAVCDEAKKFLQNRPARLIETLADAIAMALLKKFHAKKVQIEVLKFALPDAAFASVTVTRAAALD
jgi:dihydroneopterin aldolase